MDDAADDSGVAVIFSELDPDDDERGGSFHVTSAQYGLLHPQADRSTTQPDAERPCARLRALDWAGNETVSEPTCVTAREAVVPDDVQLPGPLGDLLRGCTCVVTEGGADPARALALVGPLAFVWLRRRRSP